MIVDQTIYDSFGHFTIRPYTSEIEQWLNSNVTHGKWWIAGQQHSVAFVCIENKVDYTWFLLRWT
jgi:hypothetical protein